MATTLKQMFERDRYKVAWHEAGHVTAAISFGLSVSAELYWLGTKPERYGFCSCVNGRVSSEHRTNEESAVVGWAGRMGEMIGTYRAYGIPLDWESHWKFESRLVWNYLAGGARAVILDYEMIGLPERSLFDGAVATLIAHEQRLEQEAKYLIGSLPVPRIFRKPTRTK